MYDCHEDVDGHLYGLMHPQTAIVADFGYSCPIAAIDDFALVEHSGHGTRARLEKLWLTKWFQRHGFLATIASTKPPSRPSLRLWGIVTLLPPTSPMEQASELG